MLQQRSVRADSDKPLIFGAPKVIYIVSPQPWNGFHVSKHHYAHELADLGHRVFFIDPPDVGLPRGEIKIEGTDIQGITNVRYGPWFPYRVKFHARPVFDLFMRRQAKRLVAKIGAQPDIIWDFDNSQQFMDLRVFGAKHKVFHVVDDIVEGHGTKNADVVFSVAQLFLDRISPHTLPTQVVPHGLGREFEAYAKNVLLGGGLPTEGRRPCVGYVGNLAANAIDWQAITAAVRANQSADFKFVGPVPTDESHPIHHCRTLPNCELLGFKRSAEIIALLSGIDILFLCYDPAVSVNGATNSHKVLEYLATGRPVVSNRLDAYSDSNLLMMPPTKSNAAIPDLLSAAIASRQTLGSTELRNARASFALKHTYRSHLETIDRVMTQVGVRDAHGLPPTAAS